MRRLSTAGALLVVLGALLGVGALGAARAGAQPADDDGRIAVVKVSGLLDPVLADFVERSIEQAEGQGAVWVVLQVNSSGAVVSDERVAELAEAIRSSDVPVGVWVGPSGSGARGGVAQLAGVADRLGIAPGSNLGRTGDVVVPESSFRPRFRALLGRLQDRTVGADEAEELELTDGPAPVLGEFIVDLPGIETKVVGEGEDRRRQTVTTPVFAALPIQDNLLHTVASPAVAYLLFVIGMALIVFELYTAGVGVAGLVGAGAFVLGCYGLAIVPTRPVAVALLVFSMAAFAVDVQTGVPRVWTGIGVVALALGSLLLYDDHPLSWITLLVGIGGTTLFMLAGMPAMVRTRFSTPTIGREWMVGEEGEAVADVAPDGVVRIRGALWRARTNRATPIKGGDVVRVVEVDGLLLEVEPREGGARDHRDRSR